MDITGLLDFSSPCGNISHPIGSQNGSRWAFEELSTVTGLRPYDGLCAIRLVVTSVLIIWGWNEAFMFCGTVGNGTALRVFQWLYQFIPMCCFSVTYAYCPVGPGKKYTSGHELFRNMLKDELLLLCLCPAHFVAVLFSFYILYSLFPAYSIYPSLSLSSITGTWKQRRSSLHPVLPLLFQINSDSDTPLSSSSSSSLSFYPSFFP